MNIRLLLFIMALILFPILFIFLFQVYAKNRMSHYQLMGGQESHELYHHKPTTLNV